MLVLKVATLSLKAPYSESSLSRALETVYFRPFNPTLPLWDAYFVPRFHDDETQCALFLR